MSRSERWIYPRGLIAPPDDLTEPRRPLQLYERGVWDPADEYWGEPDGMLRAVIRAHGFELERTMTTASAPWDRRLVHVASAEAVAVVVSEWAESMPNVVTVPFDPPLSFPTDLASRWPPTKAVEALIETALRLRDAQGWLTSRSATTELPED